MLISHSTNDSKTADDAIASSAAATLLGDLIDYAGLFPPAALSMTQALANYDTYSRSEWRWMLGRFVVPVSRLGEFEEAFVRLPSANASGVDPKLRLSALLGTNSTADVARVLEFNARAARSRSNQTAVIGSVEVRVATSGEIANLAAILPNNLDVYFEFPLSNCLECITTVAERGHRAKIRTGGDTADKFPPSKSVVEFIRLCADARVPFKATAGLHHPIRATHRFTYEPDSCSGVMHGFLNVFLAAAFLQNGMPTDLAVQLVEEKSAQAFQFNVDDIRWRNHRLSVDQLAAARANFAISFGSCSFTEPIDDLRSLHIL